MNMQPAGLSFDRIVPTAPAPLKVDWREQRTEGCACGGILTADPASETDVLRAVRAHQATYLHRHWFETSGWGR